MPNMPSPIRTNNGFTLVEALIVIMITGILAAMVGAFLRTPVDAYFDAARRAELTDIADTAVRRMSRDIHRALPNTVRSPPGASQCIEFMPTKLGARYRTAADGGGNGDPLDFTISDGSFDMLWPNGSILPASQRIAANDVIAIYNDGTGGHNAYIGDNAVKVASVTDYSTGALVGSSRITLSTTATAPFALKAFPAESPGNRFFVIPANEHVVAYYCKNNALYRYSRTLTGPWPVKANCGEMTSLANEALLASNISTCNIVYEPPGSGTGALSRYGLVSIMLEIKDAPSGESVRLYHQVHVDNTP